MSVFTIIVLIVRANLVISRKNCDLPSQVKTLDPSAFPLQIRHFRSTSEETPVVSAGSNLNVFDGNVPSNSLDVQEENFRAISTFYPIGETNVGEKMSNDRGEGNGELHSLEKNSRDGRKHLFEDDRVYKEPLNLVWDNCFENTYTDNKDTLTTDAKSYKDIDNSKNIEIEDIKDYRNVLYKRNSLNSNNTSTLSAWLDKYNIFRSAKGEYPLLSTKTTLLPSKLSESDTSLSNKNVIPFIPITKNILKDFTEPINITLDVVTENNINYIKETKKKDSYFEITKDKSNIKFRSLPQKQAYLIPKFKLEEGFYPFTFISKFFSVIYLFDYPVGLVKDIVVGKSPFPYSFLKVKYLILIISFYKIY
ncbi:unnamed protein product [Euphydryas editha]|uniref:Uncharacterized protein n=1 Tax=Euphydryas editha TaxID=104508 RepID=A0AAU9TJG2_EUPED|nr:unnamed protein product [Euphydryas editha]